MNVEEREIKSSLFGGYNKKQTAAYIEELQKMISDLQDSVAELMMENEECRAKAAKAESAYRLLWEKSGSQERTIESNNDLIELQKSIIAERDARIEELKKLYEAELGRHVEHEEQPAKLARFEKRIRRQIERFSGSGKKENTHG